jgi:hypothetical protein
MYRGLCKSGTCQRLPTFHHSNPSSSALLSSRIPNSSASAKPVVIVVSHPTSFWTRSNGSFVVEKTSFTLPFRDAVPGTVPPIRSNLLNLVNRPYSDHPVSHLQIEHPRWIDHWNIESYSHLTLLTSIFIVNALRLKHVY